MIYRYWYNSLIPRLNIQYPAIRHNCMNRVVIAQHHPFALRCCAGSKHNDDWIFKFPPGRSIFSSYPLICQQMPESESIFFILGPKTPHMFQRKALYPFFKLFMIYQNIQICTADMMPDVYWSVSERKKLLLCTAPLRSMAR